MKKFLLFCFTIFIAVFMITSSCDFTTTVCKDGDTQDCFCPDGSQSSQSCMTDGSGWAMCSCPAGNYSSDLGSDEGIEWCDSATGLCWQDPPYQKKRGLCWEAAVDYCDELSFDGHTDWRLPDIDELRTLVVGCSQIEVGGACQVQDGSGWDDMDAEKCTTCILGEEMELTGTDKELDDCYWDSKLQGTCNRDTDDDPSVEYWSSSSNVDDPENWAAFLHFGSGTMGFNHTISFGDVRCVRDKPSSVDTSVCAPNDTEQCSCSDDDTGAKKCASDGSGLGDCVCIGPDDAFEEECLGYGGGVSPEDCPPINITLTAPEDFPGNPYTLTAFIYTESRCCPPDGPPDGGWITHENPPLTSDTPYEMDVYTINIAQSECLAPGKYHVLITAAMSEDAPQQEMSWRAFTSEPVEIGAGPAEATVELAAEE